MRFRSSSPGAARPGSARPGSAEPVGVYFVSASNGISLSQNESHILNGTHLLVAANSLSLGTSPDYLFMGSWFLAAGSSLGVDCSPFPNRDAVLDARNSLSVSTPLDYLFIGSIFVAASNSIDLSDAVEFSRVVEILLSASSGIAIFDHVPAYKSPIYLVAASGFGVGGSLSGSKFGSVLLSAGNSMRVSAALSYARLAIYQVSAANSLGISVKSTKTRDAVVSASCSFMVGAASRQCRDISVSAVTSVGLGNDPIHKGLLAIDATSTIAFTVSASSLLTGTLASNSFSIVHLAQVVVSLPWRPVGLTRPPGGGLPHS